MVTLLEGEVIVAHTFDLQPLAQTQLEGPVLPQELCAM